MNKIAGDRLVAYLEGVKPLPASYKARAKYRRSISARRKAMRRRALKSMRDKIGLKETPQGSNNNWLVEWWYGRKGARAPWCAISVSQSYLAAGSKAFKRGVDWAYVPFLEQAAIDGDKGLMRIPIDQARPGDILTMNFDGGVADHVGMCEEPHPTHKETIEGNTDGAGGAEGGEQMRKDRPDGQISMAIRVLK